MNDYVIVQNFPLMAICTRCGSFVRDNVESRDRHDKFHATVERALMLADAGLSAAQGYPNP